MVVSISQNVKCFSLTYTYTHYTNIQIGRASTHFYMKCGRKETYYIIIAIF